MEPGRSLKRFLDSCAEKDTAYKSQDLETLKLLLLLLQVVVVVVVVMMMMMMMMT
jgi:hypothetical protein